MLSAVEFATRAARCMWAMLDTYQRTVAGAFWSAMASMKSATVAGLAGRDRAPRSLHYAVNTAVSARIARSVFGDSAPRACSAYRARFASA